MATRFADPAGPSIQAQVTASNSGDTVSCNPGIYNESVVVPSGKTIKIIPTGAALSAILDGQKTHGAAIKLQGTGKLTVWDMEIRNYKLYGVQYDSTGTGSGASYAPLRVTTPTNSADVQRCHIHHIGTTDGSTGYSTFQYAIWLNGGDQTICNDNVVHHVGDGNESIGIAIFYGYRPSIQRNEVYMVRKDGIRFGWSYRAVVDSNRTYDCWVGITHEYAVGGRVTNNISYDCVWGQYIKQINGTQALSGLGGKTIHQFWGDALGLGTNGSVPTPPEWLSVHANTVAGCRFNWIGIATQYFMDYIDLRNNLLVGTTQQNTAGANLMPGDAFIQDVGTPSLLGANFVLDYNTYVTAYGSPAFFLTKGQNTPGGTNSTSGANAAAQFLSLQGWRSQNWEVHGQVADPVFTSIGDKNFAHSTSFTGYDLTTNPVNAQGSPYGTQVGAVATTGPVPSATATVIHFIGVVDSESGHQGGGVPQRTIDLRYLTYWQSLASGSTGVGINQWIIYDFASPITFNNFLVEAQQGNGQPHRCKYEVSNDKVTWTNLSATPGLENWTSTTDVLAPDPNTSQCTHVIELASSVTARYLRFTVLDVNVPTTVYYAAVSGVYPLYVNPNVTLPPPPPPPTILSQRGRFRGRLPVAH